MDQVTDFRPKIDRKSFHVPICGLLVVVKRRGVEGLGFRVQGLGFRVQGLVFRVEGVGLRA